jgi:gliding motility associated protien GldN
MRTISVLTIVLTMVIFAFGGVTLAQDTKPEVYEKIHIPHKKPIPYPATREADVMWSKVIWRMIDLREKMNLNLYYPTKPIGERMSLISLILYGVENEGLAVYNPDQEDEFKVPLTKDEITQRMGNVAKNVQVQDSTGTGKDTTVAGEMMFDQVKKLLIKEKWYFDKNYSTMQVRVIGLCPIRVFPREIKGATSDDQENQEMSMKKVCWVYYPEARSLLSSHAVFSRHNDAQQSSFDDLFMQRRFNGYVYAESNVYNNRSVSEYTTGINALLESERIKESLTNLEHDLWEY